MEKLYALVLRALAREDGQGAVEYALVVLGIAAVIAVAVGGFTTEITSFMSAAGAKLASYV
jgi:Flp pilus assembly pilin Flp